MANSLTSEWLDENGQRDYPIRGNVNKVSDVGLFTLPYNVIVDANFYKTTDTDEQLLSITVTNTEVIFVTTSCVFTATIANTGHVALFSGESKLVVNNDALSALPTGIFTFTGTSFEASTCVYVSPEWSGVSSMALGSIGPLTGDVKLIAGVQTDFVKTSSSSFDWNVGKNLGIPLDNCYSVDPSRDNCGTQVSYINGLNVSDFQLHAMSGIRIVPDQVNNRIYIGLNFNPADVCPAIPPT